MAAPSTYSATDSAFAPVAGITLILLVVQVGKSIFSKPTPKRPTTFKLGAAANKSALTWVKLRTIKPSICCSEAIKVASC